MMPKQFDLIFLGDSLTQFHNWSNFGTHHNAGIAGDTTDGVLYRLHYTLEKKPTTLLLMIGINDLMQGQHINNMKENYLAIFDAIKSIESVYIISLLPVEAMDKTVQINESVILLNHFMKSECSERGFLYIDLYKQMVDNSIGIQKEFTNDGVHLTNKAYEVWENTLEKLF